MTTPAGGAQVRIEPAVNQPAERPAGQPDVLVIQVGTAGQWQRRCRASLYPLSTDGRRWRLDGLLTEPGFKRRGWAKYLLEAVRTWAAPDGRTVSTGGATNDLDDFYAACGCRWDDDEDEWIVA